MRRWLRDPLPEIPQIPETPKTTPSREVSGISGVSGSPLYVLNHDRAPAGDVEEHIAIAHYDGGVPERWAAGLALLHPDRPAVGFTPARWLQLINDAGGLLNRWGQKLDALAWNDDYLWACDPVAPGQRLDSAGLAVVLMGGEVRAVAYDRAVLALPEGGIRIVARSSHAGARLMLWDLPT
jgi:hypothetical protein